MENTPGLFAGKIALGHQEIGKGLRPAAAAAKLDFQMFCRATEACRA